MESSGIDIDDVIEDGECVYALCWDTGEPMGSSGCERVFLFDGTYYVLLDDAEDLDPYPTLREAITATEQLYKIGPASTEVESTELSIDEIVSLLEPFDGLEEPELRLKINVEARTIKSS